MDGNPPHKNPAHITDAKHRLEMVKLSIDSNDDFVYSDFELKRDGVIYTSDTLELLKKEHPNLDLYFITAIGMGFVKDILENNLYRFVANPEGSNDRWMMFPKKSYMSLVFNVLYAILVTGCVYFTYQGINFVGTSGNNDRVVFGVEPIFFGIFYMGFELLFLWMKHMAVRIIADAKKKVEGGV